ARHVERRRLHAPPARHRTPVLTGRRRGRRDERGGGHLRTRHDRRQSAGLGSGRPLPCRCRPVGCGRADVTRRPEGRHPLRRALRHRRPSGWRLPGRGRRRPDRRTRRVDVRPPQGGRHTRDARLGRRAGARPADGGALMASRAVVVVFTGLVAIGAASLAAAQPPPPPPPPPPRDVGPPAAIDPVPGGAIISGVVVTTDATPRPVRRAVVRITGAGGERTVVTDDEGRFSIDDLPAGRFGIVASRPGYVTMAYGARRPGGQGTQITLIRGGAATLTI